MEEINWTDHVKNTVQHSTAQSKGGTERPTYNTTKKEQLHV